MIGNVRRPEDEFVRFPGDDFDASVLSSTEEICFSLRVWDRKHCIYSLEASFGESRPFVGNVRRPEDEFVRFPGDDFDANVLSSTEEICLSLAVWVRVRVRDPKYCIYSLEASFGESRPFVGNIRRPIDDFFVGVTRDEFDASVSSSAEEICFPPTVRVRLASVRAWDWKHCIYSPEASLDQG